MTSKIWIYEAAEIFVGQPFSVDPARVTQVSIEQLPAPQIFYRAEVY